METRKLSTSYYKPICTPRQGNSLKDIDNCSGAARSDNLFVTSKKRNCKFTNPVFKCFCSIFCAFCQSSFRWVYYYGSNKSTGKETDKTHLCALSCGYRIIETILCNFVYKNLLEQLMQFSSQIIEKIDFRGHFLLTI